jgi:hypothetical protein
MADDSPILAHLLGAVGLKDRSVAEEYAKGLEAQGFDDVDTFDELTSDELATDFGFKRGHVRAVEKYHAKKKTQQPVASASSPPADAAEVGSPVGMVLSDGSTITLGAMIGRGGSGVVRTALMTRQGGGTQQDVAAKMLAPGATQREHQKFAAEIEVSMKAAQACHGVCQMFGSVIADGCLCLVMKRYVQTLQDYLERHVDASGSARAPLDLETTLEFALQVARTLGDLHAVGIFVQDLKPANLLLDEHNAVAVADFGIAALAEVTITSTASKTGLGTPMYMAPEQFDPDIGPVSDKSDVWALACIIVEMLSGRAPWAKPDGTVPRQQQIMTAIMMKKQSPALPAGLPPALADVLTTCFSHEPTQRPSAKELLATLRPLRVPQGTAIVGAAQAGGVGVALQEAAPGSDTYLFATSALTNTWTKREAYELEHVDRVDEIVNPALQARYEEYKQRLAAGPSGVPNGNETLLFHGCGWEADGPLSSIAAEGFLKRYWTTAAGSWQRFGPGFYFGEQARAFWISMLTLSEAVTSAMICDDLRRAYSV